MSTQGEAPVSDDLFDRAALHALYKKLNIPGVVDAHCHFMPQDLQDKVWRWFDEKAPLPWPITYRGDEGLRRRWLEELGVMRYTTLNYAHKPGLAEALNRYTLEFLDRDPKAIGTGTFYPEAEAEAQVEGMLRDPRIKGFKLHLQVGGFHPDDPLLHPCYARIEEAGRVLILHGGSAPLAGPHTHPEAVESMLARFPRLKVVLAHMGAYESEHYMELAGRRQNLYFDTAMVFVDFGAVQEMSEAAIAKLTRLQDRILFGSDYPSIPYPYEHGIEALHRLGLGDGWLKAVLYENALRLFGGQ